MLPIIAKRLLLAIPVILAITGLLFGSVVSLLGSPAAMMLGQDANPAAIAALNAKYGFDRPLHEQYFMWLGSALHGDLGRSFATQESVSGAVLAALPVTLELTIWSILVAAIGAVVLNTMPFGRRLLSPLITAGSIVGITIPNFMLGILLIFVFSVGLGLLPSTGWSPWASGAADHLRHLIMPVFTLAAYYFGVFSIVYRAELRNVGQHLYVQVARAKGVSETGVLFKHALPNAVLPVITFVGISMGQLMGGAVVTETVFSMPGIGRLFVAAITARDFPVMLAVGMLIVAGVVVMNLLADIAYTIVNPKIRHR